MWETEPTFTWVTAPGPHVLILTVRVFSGHTGIFLHKDPETSYPEGLHGQLHSRRERLWEPRWKQLHVGRKSVFTCPAAQPSHFQWQ